MPRELFASGGLEAGTGRRARDKVQGPRDLLHPTGPSPWSPV